ncbi:hypothetical protein FKM82_018572, partial [Ascaphus truei]
SHRQAVLQPHSSQSVLQGEALLLNCTYSYSGSLYPYWHVRNNNKALEMLGNSLGQKEHLGFTAKQEQRESSSRLSKGEAEVTDSGEYYCAVSDTGITACSSPVT